MDASKEASSIEAEELLKRANKLAERLNQLYEQSLEESEEAKRLDDEIGKLFNKAITLYENALESNKNNKWLWLKLGDAYKSNLVYQSSVLTKNENEYGKKSIHCYLNALRNHLREFPEILKRMGLIKDPSDSKELASSIDKLFGSILLIDVEDIRKLQINLLKIYLENYPDDAEVWLKLADHCAEVGEIKEAEQYCEKALRIDPANIRVVALSGHFYEHVALKTFGDERLRLLNRTVELLKRRCKLEPNELYPWAKLVEIYSTYAVKEGKRDLDGAIQCMEEYIKRARKVTWRSWKKLGDLYFENNDREKALKYYSKALEVKLKDQS